jgi:hypothetical protein
LACKTARIEPNGARFSQIFDNIFVFGRKFQPKVQLLAAEQSENALLNVAGSVIFESTLQEEIDNLKLLVKIFRRGIAPPSSSFSISSLLPLVKMLFPLLRRYAIDRRAFNVGDKGIYLNVNCEQMPSRESQLTLDPLNSDSLGVPGVVLRWQLDGREIETISAFTKNVARFMELNDLAKLDIFPGVQTQDPSVLVGARDTYHMGGGLRMGSDAAQGVVDKGALVFGTSNLYIAGAAVFPTSGHANSTLTALALALRLARSLVR